MKMMALSSGLARLVSISHAAWNPKGLDGEGHFNATKKQNTRDLHSFHNIHDNFLYMVTIPNTDTATGNYDISILQYYFAVREGAFLYVTEKPVSEINESLLHSMLTTTIDVKEALEFIEL